MKLILYADESGTHDETGRLPGSQFPIICGVVATEEMWREFSNGWQTALRRHRACYFHFSEWATASAIARGERAVSRKELSNPYLNWSKDKLDFFLLDLAEVLSTSDVLPVLGGGVNAEAFHEAKESGEFSKDLDPRVLVLAGFLRNLDRQIAFFRSRWRHAQIAIVFDQGTKSWQRAITKEHEAVKQSQPLFNSLIFSNNKHRSHFPLQAADMVAYRYRQMTDATFRPSGLKIWNSLDKLVFRALSDALDNTFIEGK